MSCVESKKFAALNATFHFLPKSRHCFKPRVPKLVADDADTTNDSEWVDCADDDSEDEWEDCGDEDSESDSSDDSKTLYKMVFVVNCNLGMGAGKIASQVSVYNRAGLLYGANV